MLHSSPSDPTYPHEHGADARSPATCMPLPCLPTAPAGKTAGRTVQGAHEPCGQRLYRPVCKQAVKRGIKPPVDIHPPYPQARHRSRSHRPTVCPPIRPPLKVRDAEPRIGLSTEKQPPININIIYLLKIYSLYCLFKVRLQIKLTLWPCFSRISDPLKGLSGSVVNYSGI